MRIQPPAPQIGKPRLSLRRGKCFIKEAARFPVDFQNSGAQPGHAVVHAVLRHGHARPLGKPPHRVGKGQVFHAHDELEHAPSLIAAKTVKGIIFRINIEGGRFLIVEGAQPQKCFPPPLQIHIGGSDIGNGAAGIQFPQKFRREGHISSSFA